MQVEILAPPFAAIVLNRSANNLPLASAHGARPQFCDARRRRPIPAMRIAATASDENGRVIDVTGFGCCTQTVARPQTAQNPSRNCLLEADSALHSTV